MHTFRIIFLSVFMIVCLSGCGGSPDTTTPSPEPAVTEAIVEPTEPVEQADPGEVLFRTRCASCHNLSDVAQVGPGLAGLFSRETLPNGQDFSGEALADFITQGTGAMPGVPLNTNQLEELIAYLREATQ